MRNDAFAPPLTVLVGPARYVFAPGRDVAVGHGSGWDVPLGGPGPAGAAPQPELVLRHTGSHWVAIDNGGYGIFLSGARMSAVDIRDGLAITLGDPQRGPRLVFRLGAPTGPPGPHPNGRPARHRRRSSPPSACGFRLPSRRRPNVPTRRNRPPRLP
ncbi:ABC transporter [Mycobacterium rhizamassiliense]|uniref:ABC transporter n=1 Tax=Mycobacterium rhizamassiliense TaxID=1841860 RepID=A0A2U3NX17_9MYCO|nr:ABC transporter [Mycobacterium rhizamassiliense]